MHHHIRWSCALLWNIRPRTASSTGSAGDFHNFPHDTAQFNDLQQRLDALTRYHESVLRYSRSSNHRRGHGDSAMSLSDLHQPELLRQQTAPDTVSSHTAGVGVGAAAGTGSGRGPAMDLSTEGRTIRRNLGVDAPPNTHRAHSAPAPTGSNNATGLVAVREVLNEEDADSPIVGPADTPAMISGSGSASAGARAGGDAPSAGGVQTATTQSVPPPPPPPQHAVGSRLRSGSSVELPDEQKSGAGE